MKRFQENLLIVLALSLCGLCVYQWYGQTAQRTQIESLSRTVFDKNVAIQGYTNSMATMDRRIAQMDARITELKAAVQTNEMVVATQQRELTELKIAKESLARQAEQYQKAVGTLEDKLAEAYDGIKKQNQAFKELVTQRDEFVAKLNENTKERNDVVRQYNELVEKIKNAQTESPKPEGK